jgi:hypothetical protein
MGDEKRKYVRFIAGPNTFAALGSSYTKIGKIRDISMGGLAFEYCSGIENSTRQDSSVTIFITVNNFYLENLPCLIICDHPKDSSNETHFLNSNYTVKQCSLQFMTISEDQRQHLDFFLNNYTQGIAPSSAGLQEMNQESGWRHRYLKWKREVVFRTNQRLNAGDSLVNIIIFTIITISYKTTGIVSQKAELAAGPVEVFEFGIRWS